VFSKEVKRTVAYCCRQAAGALLAKRQGYVPPCITAPSGLTGKAEIPLCAPALSSGVFGW